eukprot:2655168-Prymnesium_polylepis.1
MRRRVARRIKCDGFARVCRTQGEELDEVQFERKVKTRMSVARMSMSQARLTHFRGDARHQEQLAEKRRLEDT